MLDLLQVLSPFGNQKRVLNGAKLTTGLTLIVFRSSVLSTLLYDCESWKRTEKVARELDSVCSKMLSNITGREIAAEAITPTVKVLSRTIDF